MLPKKEEIKLRMVKSVDVLRDEFMKIRTGRANPDMVASIKVEAYDSKMPVNQLANINIPDPRTIVVQPWDKNVIDAIAKAIEEDNSGLTPTIDGEIIRIKMPALNEETRLDYVKLMKEKLEECRVAMRQIRQDAVQEYDKAKEKGDINEDQSKKWREEMDELIGEMNKMVEDIGEKKEKEIMTV